MRRIAPLMRRIAFLMRRLGPTLAVALLGLHCGHDFQLSPGPPRAATLVAATYDVKASYPGLVFPEFPATGLDLDLMLEIDPNSLDDPSGRIAGTVTIVEADVGGAARPFSPQAPVTVAGRLAGGEIDLEPFGPITVGATVLFPDLVGILSTDGRRIDGVATFGNLTDTGSFFGIKQRRYLVASSDFTLQGTATVVTVRYGSQFKVDRDVELISGDPVAAASAGVAMIVNRLSFDNVQVLDPARGFATAFQFSTGNGSNPHDALVAGGKIFIPRYEPPFDDVLIADAATGAPLGSIPLETYATNSSRTPRPDRVVEANGTILVTLQNIDTTFFDYGPGVVVFVDPATGGVVRSITLAGRNPIGPPSIRPDNGDVYLADAGIFQGTLPRSLSGGIEVIDPVALATRGLLADDDDLGGNVSGVAVASGTVGYAVVVRASGRNDVVAFDPATGSLLGTVLSTPALVPEIRYDGDGFLLVAEHDPSNPRLRVIDAATGLETTRIPLSLPPFSIAVLSRSLLASR